MGNSDSKLVFKQDIFKLSSSEPIAPADPYWQGFYELPACPDDIFSLFTPVDIRRARDSSPKNLETLIHTLTTRLFYLRQHRSFPNAEVAPDRQALNCIRILTRILPFIYEDEKWEAWDDELFWKASWARKISSKEDGKTEILFDKDAEVNEQDQDSQQQEALTKTRPTGETLIDALIDLLFMVGFTVSTTDRSRSKVTYAIWQKGVGCTTSMVGSKEMESNRIEVLRLLLTLVSKSLYIPAHVLPIKGVKALTYLATCPDKQIVLSLLCSQLNTSLNYNTTSWRVPYDHVVYKDPNQVLVTYSMQLLLSLLLYTVPEDSKGYTSKNYFRHFLGRLHRLPDFEFIVDGISRTLRQSVQASSSYLPGSQKTANWIPEMIMLFWETLQCNKRFRAYVIDGDRGHEFMIFMTFYAMEYRNDAAKQGIVRMCVFVLQTMSTEANFGKLLNQEIDDLESIPASVRGPDFHGTYGDFLIISIHSLMTSRGEKLEAIYPSMLATINNVAPYLEHLSLEASSRMLQLFSSMSSPSFLLANETNYALLKALLESMNAIIEHQYMDNRAFIEIVFRYGRKITSLRSFTLESGQAELQRLSQRRKAASMDSNPTSPGRLSHRSSIEGPQSPQTPRSSALPNVPEDGTFAIGEDDDDDDEMNDAESASNREDQEHLLTPTQSSRAPSIASSQGDTLPTQLRGMSEKARGKMPAGQPSFSRQNSSTSITTAYASNNPLITSPTISTTGRDGTFAPDPAWIDTWLPTLPLHTLLTLLSYSAPPATLPPEIEATPPRLHSFEWTPLSLGWYQSLLWGFIFASEMVVQRGTVGIWNTTNIKLFRVQAETAHGPSLREPMGAVDAVGKRLVSGVQSLTLRTSGATASRSRSANRAPVFRDV